MVVHIIINIYGEYKIFQKLFIKMVRFVHVTPFFLENYNIYFSYTVMTTDHQFSKKLRENVFSHLKWWFISKLTNRDYKIFHTFLLKW